MTRAMEGRVRAACRVVLVLCLGLLCGAGPARAGETLAASGLDELGDTGLVQAILAYYEAEKARDWETTYALRGPSFAAVVPFDTYVRQMENDAAGWELVGIDGRSTGVDGAVVNVTLAFQEDLAPEVAARLLGPELAGDGGDRPQRYTQPELTQWTREQGQWVALAPGARQHFVFNERLVWDAADGAQAAAPAPAAGPDETP